MGEVKRYTPDTFGDGVVMVEVRADERYETSDETEFCEARDIARLERERDELSEELQATEDELEGCMEELTRLRAVEKAALELIRQSGDEFGHADGTRLREVHDADLTALAEACGRKG